MNKKSQSKIYSVFILLCISFSLIVMAEDIISSGGSSTILDISKDLSFNYNVVGDTIYFSTAQGDECNASMSGATINTKPYKSGVEFDFRGTGAIPKLIYSCDNPDAMNYFDFSSVEREYSEPIYNDSYEEYLQSAIDLGGSDLSEEDFLIGYDVKPQRYAFALDSKKGEVTFTQNGGSALSLADVWVIDPYFVVNLSTDAITEGVVCEGGGIFCHLNVSDTDLVAYYPFDVPNKTQNIYDYGRDYDGTLTGNVTWTSDGYYGGAYEFGGISGQDYITIGTGTDFADICGDGCSFSAWVRPPVAGGTSYQRTVIGRYDFTGGNQFWKIFWDRFGQFFFVFDGTGDVENGCSISPSVVDYEQWNFVTATVNSSSVALFHNGALAETTDCNTTINTSISGWYATEATFIGVHDDGTLGNVANGTIDEVMIFNRTLSPTEIQQIYNASLPLFDNLGNLTTNVSIDAGNDSVSIIINETNQGSSNLSLRISDDGGATWSDYQNISDGENITFTINDASTMLNLSFLFIGDGNTTQTFWSPILQGNVSVATYPSGAEADTEYPIFANYSVNWTNGSAYSLGRIYEFNITATSSDGTAILVINGANHTATNRTISATGDTIITQLYNASVFLPAGNYTYNWTSYGNGTDQNFNWSDNQGYSVALATTELDLFLNHTQANITIGEGDIIALNGTSVTSEGNLTIYINGSILNSSLSQVYNLYNFTAFGNHNITLTHEGTQNYTNYSETYFVNVTDPIYPAFSNYQTTPNNNTEYYPTIKHEFNISVTHTDGTIILDLNGTNYTATSSDSGATYNVTLQLSAGEYEYNWSSYGLGSQSNFNWSDTNFYTVTQNETLVLGISGTTPITYGEETDVAGSGCPTQLSCSLDNANAVYGAGTHFFNYSTAGNINYTASSINISIIVNQNSSLIYLYLNNSRSNITIYEGTIINLNSSIITGDQTNATISINGTILNSSLTSTYNSYNFTALGLHNITAIYYETNNYTQSNETFWVNVTSIPIDAEYPKFSNFSVNPANNTNYSYGRILFFNTTIVSTNDTVVFSIGDSNYTATNTTTSDWRIYNVSVPILTAGEYFYNWSSYGNGTDALFNISENNGYTISKNYSLTYLFLNNSRANLSINTGDVIEINGSKVTGDAQNITVYINGTILNSSLTSTYNQYNFTANGEHNITIVYLESANFTQSNETWWVNVTSIPTDEEYPLFTNYTSNITNGTAYSSGQVYDFNVTAISSNGTAILTFDGTNYTATNRTISDNLMVYFASVSNLPAGNYTYNWTSYGNGTLANFNYSDNREYTISLATGEVNLTLNGQEGSIDISKGENIQINGTIISGEGNLTLYINGDIANSSASSVINVSNFTTEGIHNITVLNEHYQNYTRSFETWFVNVTDLDYPYFTNITDNTGTLTDSGTATFNSTIYNTNYSVGLTFDGTNYTPTNNTNIDYNISLSLASSGTFTYFWWAYGNGSLKNYNQSADQSYEVLSSAGPVGGGGGIGAGPSFNVSEDICREVYDNLLIYGVSGIHIEEIKDSVKRKTGKTISTDTINTYRYSWQGLCSDLIHRTLNPEFVCQKVYSFLKEEGYSYSLDDFERLNSELRKEVYVSDGLSKYYIDNNKEVCSDKGYSEKLPSKPLALVISEGLSNISYCTIDTGISLLDSGFSIFGEKGIGLGNNVECRDINFLRLIFKMEKSELGDYSLVGFKIWIFVFAIAVISLVVLFRPVNSKGFEKNITDKIIREMFKIQKDLRKNERSNY